MDDEEFELRSVSVRLDGRGTFLVDCVETQNKYHHAIASIEHQIDIHVTDLVESAVNPDISLTDVLAGLEYVMDYRIRGDKMPNLDQGSMDRLATGLLQTMGSRTGNLLGQKFTPEADVAFKLFGAFLQEVIEFQTAISVLPASELQFHLMLHKRAVGGSKEEREFTAAVVALVLAHSKQVSDPKELTRESDGDLIDGLMKEFPEKFQVPDIGEAKVTNPFPPQGILRYFLFVPQQISY